KKCSFHTLFVSLRLRVFVFFARPVRTDEPLELRSLARPPPVPRQDGHRAGQHRARVPPCRTSLGRRQSPIRKPQSAIGASSPLPPPRPARRPDLLPGRGQPPGHLR